MDFDVLVIGSGAGGGVAALRLCEKGLKVGLIERGKRFQPKRDYILNHPDWSERLDPLGAAKRNEQTIDLSYRTKFTTSSGETIQRNQFNYHRVHGVGGSTLHYQGEAHRFTRESFETKTRYGWGVDWPVNYQDLAPYYEQIEKLLGVAGENNNPHKPQRSTFPTPAHPLSERSQFLAQSAKLAGMSLLQNTLALPSRSVDGRLPCQHSGGCIYGCIFGAKSSVDQAIIPKAESTGNLTLLSDWRALKINAKANKINSIDCVKEKQHKRFTAKYFVLALGALETPRLLLQSKSSIHPNGVANPHDQVGRYFMETLFAGQTIDLQSLNHPYLGPPFDSRIWDYVIPQNSDVSGFVLGALASLTQRQAPANAAISLDGIGRQHKKTLRENFGKSTFLIGIAEQEPQHQNRVHLSSKVDKQGVPKLIVHSEYSRRDLSTLDIIQNKLLLWSQNTPNAKLGPMVSSLYNSSATHVAGTCRMGEKSKHSVVDAWGKLHNIDNGYVADASVLPGQGAGDSPSLTIQALALRTADKVAEQING